MLGALKKLISNNPVGVVALCGTVAIGAGVFGRLQARRAAHHTHIINQHINTVKDLSDYFYHEGRADERSGL